MAADNLMKKIQNQKGHIGKHIKKKLGLDGGTRRRRHRGGKTRITRKARRRRKNMRLRRKRKKLQRRRRTRRRYSKKGGAPPIDIHPGDILIMNFGGRVPLSSYKHVAVAVQGLVNNDGKPFLPLAHCVTRGCILSGLEYIPNKNNKTIWVLRYSGPDKEYLREYAADIASIWATSGKLQFSKCRMLRAALPCFWKQADRKTGKKYIRALTTMSQLPRYDNEKYIEMFCSKFGLAVWMAALGSFNTDKDHFKWEVLDKCLPLKPSNCAPWDLMSLPKKIPACWEKIGEFKGWGEKFDIGIKPEADAEEGATAEAAEGNSLH